MRTKHIYVAVLLMIMAAWFAQGPTNQAKQIRKDAGTPPPQGQITTSPAIFGFNPGEISVGGKCNIEFINDAPMSADTYDIARNHPLKLVGWAMDDQKERLPQRVIVRFSNSADKHFYVAARTGLIRDDVRAYFKLSDRIMGAGFDMNLDMHDLPPGVYSLDLLMQFDDKIDVCDNGRKVNVK